MYFFPFFEECKGNRFFLFSKLFLKIFLSFFVCPLPFLSMYSFFIFGSAKICDLFHSAKCFFIFFENFLQPSFLFPDLRLHSLLYPSMYVPFCLKRAANIYTYSFLTIPFERKILEKIQITEEQYCI